MGERTGEEKRHNEMVAGTEEESGAFTAAVGLVI